MKSIPEFRAHPGIRAAVAILYGLMGFSSMVTGWAYLPWTQGPAEIPAGLVWATSLAPLPVWAGAWVVAGAAGIAAACTQLRRTLFALSISFLGAMHFFWFMFYAWSYLFLGDPRGYVGAASYLRGLVLLMALAVVIAVLRPKVTKAPAHG